MMLLSGTFAHTTGSCPVCGNDCARTHAFDGRSLRDSYGCYRCGPVEYAVRA